MFARTTSIPSQPFVSQCILSLLQNLLYNIVNYSLFYIPLDNTQNFKSQIHLYVYAPPHMVSSTLLKTLQSRNDVIFEKSTSCIWLILPTVYDKVVSVLCRQHTIYVLGIPLINQILTIWGLVQTSKCLKYSAHTQTDTRLILKVTQPYAIQVWSNKSRKKTLSNHHVLWWYT